MWGGGQVKARRDVGLSSMAMHRAYGTGLWWGGHPGTHSCHTRHVTSTQHAGVPHSAALCQRGNSLITCTFPGKLPIIAIM